MAETSTATASPNAAAPPAPDGWVIGVMGGPDPRAALERSGLVCAHWDRRLAMAGSITVTDELVVGGRQVFDQSSPNAGLDHAAAAWSSGGPKALTAQHDTFGLAIYDRVDGALILARDPLGERTIYVTAALSDGSVWFSDRLTSLRALGVVGRELSLEALRDYLIFAYVPGTQTMYAGAEEVAPGTTLELPSRVATSHWAPIEHTDTGATLKQNASLVRTLLSEAVASRRPAGPAGVYLSGGVDSSAITALLCESDPSTVHTIAVHFGRDLPNELAFVDQVVDWCRPAQHHEIELSSTELAAVLPATMAALDDPIGDPLTVPNLALGRRAAEVAPVIFNGEGGDPVFGGPKNQPMLLANLYGSADDIDDIYLRSYQKCYPDLHRLLQPDVQEQLMGTPPPVERVAGYLSGGEMEEFVNRLFLANTRMKGCDHILTKVANLTAAAGLIGRSPLFDRRLVEAAFAIPPGHKLHGTVEKAVLKLAVNDLLPATIIDRPKAGMRVPVQTWFRGPLRREGSKRLLSRRARIAPYLDRNVIKEWTRYDGDPRGRYGRKLWLLLSLEYWMEAHDVG